MRDWLPAELRGTLPLELPTNIESATTALRTAHVALDPREIDLHQLATLLCRLIAGDSPEAYLRSPRVKGRVPQEWQSTLDEALGSVGYRRPATALDFLQLLVKTSLTPIEALPKDSEPDGNSTGSDTSPSIYGKDQDGDTGVRDARKERLTGKDSTVSPTRLGHYEVVGWIGHGGMGDVYRGYERALDRTVALKVLPAELSSEPEFVRRFYAEASAAARIVHPHVIQIYFIGEDAGRHFFAMQYVDGESLAMLLDRRGRLSTHETLNVLEEVLSGLGAAHRQGLIHRDVKPGNILLDRVHQRALLADFGLVKSLVAMEGKTATGIVMGTVDYIAPEQGRGLPVDHRCDLYAIGVLAYQMLSGRLPFSADSPTALIFQHVYEPAPPLGDDVPAPLAAVVAKLMAKSRDRRHASAEAVLADLRAIRSGGPLPSGADVELAADPRTFLAADPPRDTAPFATTRVIHAPRFSDEPWLLSDEQLPDPASTWWTRLRARWSDWLRSRTPEWVAQLQSTQHQIGGAIAEYERRRDQLRDLVREANDVLADLRAALSARPEDADLVKAAAEQEEQRGQMQLRLSQVETTLTQLCHQRYLLQARLKAAHAKLHIAGKKPTQLSARPGTRLRLSILIVVMATLCVAAARNGTRIQNSFVSIFGLDRHADPTKKTPPPVAEVTTSTVTASASSIERRAAFTTQSNQFVTSTYNPSKGRSSRKSDRVLVEMKLWDLTTGTEVLNLQQPHRSSRMAISPDGQLLLSAGRDAATDLFEIKIWDLKTGNLQSQIKRGIPADMDVGFSSDSRTAYSLLGTSFVKELGAIDVLSGRVESISFPQSQDQAAAVAFCPTRDWAAIAIVQTVRNGRQAIDLYDLQRRRLMSSIPLTKIVRKLTFSEDGNFLAAIEPGQTTLWSTKDWSIAATFQTKLTGYEEIALSRDATSLALSHRDGVELINVTTKSPVPTTFSGNSIKIGFTSGGTFTVIPEHGRITFFNPVTGKEQLAPKLTSR
jgi:serine/threonine protein kinase